VWLKCCLQIKTYIRYPAFLLHFLKVCIVIINLVNFEEKINVGSFRIKLLKTNWRIFVLPITFNGKLKIQWVWKNADIPKNISATHCFYFSFIKSTYQSFTIQIYSQKQRRKISGIYWHLPLNIILVVRNNFHSKSRWLPVGYVIDVTLYHLNYWSCSISMKTNSHRLTPVLLLCFSIWSFKV